ncbi:NUDIX hydrolase [Caulobacter sp.]|uniref:NUDIX hydrolase n=1 Tax=Caulobacter sp. TaxID=78 RepID=UPI003BACF8C8
MADGKWRVTASRYVHKDRWIAVRADDCVTDEGVVVAPYYVLDYPDWVQIVALDAADNVLLIRQYRHGLGDFSIELPAGAMDASDDDPLVAAARELLEETGCAGDLTLIGQTSPNPANHANRIHTVVARNVVVVAEPADDPTERIERFWVTPEEAVRMAMTGEITTAIQIASLLVGLTQAGVTMISRPAA